MAAKDDVSEKNNPRPLKTTNDFSKLLYRIDVSKDLMRAMILKSNDVAREKTIKQKLDDGLSLTQIQESEEIPDDAES